MQNRVVVQESIVVRDPSRSRRPRAGGLHQPSAARPKLMGPHDPDGPWRRLRAATLTGGRRRPAHGGGLALATLAALVAVLLAQAVVIVIAEPWPEGGVLLVLSRGHGVAMGDLPAVALVLGALAASLLSLPLARHRSLA